LSQAEASALRTSLPGVQLDTQVPVPSKALTATPLIAGAAFAAFLFLNKGHG
jgi:hypothetical protein